MMPSPRRVTRRRMRTMSCQLWKRIFCWPLDALHQRWGERRSSHSLAKESSSTGMCSWWEDNNRTSQLMCQSSTTQICTLLKHVEVQKRQLLLCQSLWAMCRCWSPRRVTLPIMTRRTASTTQLAKVYSTLLPKPEDSSTTLTLTFSVTPATCNPMPCPLTTSRALWCSQECPPMEEAFSSSRDNRVRMDSTSTTRSCSTSPPPSSQTSSTITVAHPDSN